MLSNLPNEILINIFKNNSINDILNIFLVCKKFYNIKFYIFKDILTNVFANNKKLMHIYLLKLMEIDDFNFYALKWFIKIGYNINYSNKDYPLLITYASINNKINFLKNLLFYNYINFDVIDNITFTTPLWHASDEGNYEICKLLVEKGSNINYQIFNSHLYENGTTPLYWACVNGFTNIVKLLIENNADINLICQDDNTTGLFMAICHKHTEIVEILLQNNANVNINNYKNQSPLFWACLMGYNYLIKLLIEKGAEINIKTNENETLLSILCENNNIEIIEYLLLKNIKICNDDYEISPIYIAVKNGFKNILLLFLKYDKNLDLNILNNKDEDLLNVAVQNNHLEIIKILLYYKKNFNYNGLKNNPFYMCIKENKVKIFEYLIQNIKLNLNEIYCDDNNFLLLEAVRCKNYFIVKLLLYVPYINVNKSTLIDGTTALLEAVNNNDEIIVNLLLQHPNININKGFYINKTTPLFNSIDQENYVITKMLLQNGANKYLKNIYNISPLKLAYYKYQEQRNFKNFEILKLLKNF